MQRATDNDADELFEMANLFRIAGHLSPDDQRAVFKWVSLNTAAIVDGRIDTVELGQLLKTLP